MDLQRLRERHDVDNVLGSSIDDSTVDESKAVDLVLDPGDVSGLHPNVIHGAHANESDRWRRGLTIRYIPASTRITEEASNPDIAASGRVEKDRPFPSAFFLRGTPDPEGNRYNPWPLYDAGMSRDFAERVAWDRRAGEANARYAAVIVG